MQVHKQWQKAIYGVEEELLIDEAQHITVAPLPHIVTSFFARRPYKRKIGHYPKWNYFYMLLYRDVEEGWKLMQMPKNPSYADFIPILEARSKAVQEIKRRFGNDLEATEEL